MLAFDHRRSIRGLFGIATEPTSADAGRIAAAKLLILDGLLAARERLDSGAPAVLVDEQFGAAVLDAARDRSMVTAVACERSGHSLDMRRFVSDGRHDQHSRAHCRTNA